MVLEAEVDRVEELAAVPVFEAEDEDVVGVRSVKRLVEPRWAPRLVAPVPVELVA